MINIDKSPHIPVLLSEVLDSFKTVQDGTFIDCTLGYAGHSYEILKQYSNLSLIGIDRDDEALKFSKKKLAPFENRVKFLKGSFSKKLQEIDFSNVKALLADFGVSSLQLDFLNWFLVRRTWFGQFDELYFVLNWQVMRCKLRPNLRQTRSRQHDPK